MVLGSELAFRMLCRKHGARTCYTPMIRAEDLLASHRASTRDGDRPLPSGTAPDCTVPLSPTEGRLPNGRDRIEDCESIWESSRALASSEEEGAIDTCHVQEADPMSNTCISSETKYVEPDNRMYRPRTCDGDRPLVVQLCGRDPESLAEASRAAVSQFYFVHI